MTVESRPKTRQEEWQRETILGRLNDLRKTLNTHLNPDFISGASSTFAREFFDTEDLNALDDDSLEFLAQISLNMKRTSAAHDIVGVSGIIDILKEAEVEIGAPESQKICFNLFYDDNQQLVRVDLFTRNGIWPHPYFKDLLRSSFYGTIIKEGQARNFADRLYRLPENIDLTWSEFKIRYQTGEFLAQRAVGVSQEGRKFELYIDEAGISQFSITEPDFNPSWFEGKALNHSLYPK